MGNCSCGAFSIMDKADIWKSLTSVPTLYIPENMLPVLFDLPDPITAEAVEQISRDLRLRDFQRVQIQIKTSRHILLWVRGEVNRNWEETLDWSQSFLCNLLKQIYPDELSDSDEHEVLRFCFVSYGPVDKNA